MIKQRVMNRMNSDRADSNSVSMILWIVFTVVLVITVGGIIFASVKKKGVAVGKCIDSANNIFSTAGNTGTGSTDCSNSK